MPVPFAADTAYHSKLHQALYAISAMTVIVLGVYFSHIGFMNIEWLSRAGCLVVMIGVWSGIGGIFQERLLIGRMNWRLGHALKRAKTRHVKEHVAAEDCEKELALIATNFETKLSAATQRLKLSVGVLEVSLLMTGTFLWGFGDLLVG